MVRRGSALFLPSLASMLLAIVLAPRSARADAEAARSLAVAVLAFDSEDAEEQADALTGAMRSRVRASQAWSLLDATQRLGMLRAALRCPGKPLTLECQQKVSAQIKAERYIFGYVAKGPHPGHVTAELHLYQRGKPEIVVKESYADKLHDQNDDTLRKIAQRALDRLGSSVVGAVVVRSQNDIGEVIVDGAERVPLKSGAVRIELAPGAHSIEMKVPEATERRNVLVAAGKEIVLIAPAATPPRSLGAGDEPFPTRKVIGFTALGLAFAGGVVSAIHVARYSDAQNEADENRARFQAQLPAGMDSSEACESAVYSPLEVCRVEEKSKRSSTIAIVSGSIGGAFLVASGVLLLTDWFSGDKHPGREKSASAKTRLAPAFGTTTASLSLTGSF